MCSNGLQAHCGVTGLVVQWVSSECVRETLEVSVRMTNLPLVQPMFQRVSLMSNFCCFVKPAL
jgi:hypothetical protein